MTVIDDYRKTLKDLIKKYDVKSVLEIGVEKGISTQVFCDAGCEVKGLDIQDLGYRHENLDFIKCGASEYLDKLERKPQFDMIYLDAFYTYERLKYDVPICWDLLRDGGIIVFNEYIDFANHRNGEIRKFVHEWANENMRLFTVYPLRNGFAVLEK